MKELYELNEELLKLRDLMDARGDGTEYEYGLLRILLGLISYLISYFEGTE
ncbi:hypothetical protein ES708_19849 [subsurface metagenome]